ncbi:chorismate--pyruvate lyase family protein [Sedimenticola sp.]|uniref:chorismate--pyruvate lyase family protein n=1 Tax=Sedimenticola sp. TaxID=1940285 RepID=UPI00258CC93E|nr:chorismate lyase [Sedimenticola sp.]MCW8904041.1 chorismate lyase [Sedimenticola sp.]
MKRYYSRGEPNWTPWRRFRHHQVPAEIEQWLRDGGSLTARLKRAAQGDFRVNLRRQGWARPLDSERRLLGMRRGGIAMLREVELLCGGVPWVFARTLIPVRSLKGPARRLAMLGERPLGEVLFTDPSMRRGVTQIARLLPGHALFSSAMVNLQTAEAIWGRRTLFHLAGKPLLVNELFLPDIPTSSS